MRHRGALSTLLLALILHPELTAGILRTLGLQITSFPFHARPLRGGTDWLAQPSEDSLDLDSPAEEMGAFGWGRRDEYGEKIEDAQVEVPDMEDVMSTSDSEWRCVPLKKAFGS